MTPDEAKKLKEKFPNLFVDTELALSLSRQQIMGAIHMLEGAINHLAEAKKRLDFACFRGDARADETESLRLHITALLHNLENMEKRHNWETPRWKHNCGAQGFGYGPDDKCKACEQK